MNRSVQQHLKDPDRCPYCGDQTVEGDSVEIESGGAKQRVRCLSCDRQWWDVYRLFAIVDDGDWMHERVRGAVSSGAEKSDRDMRQRDIVPPERLAEARATVVGVGAIGRQVALQLAAMGIPWLQLIDSDVVEPVNLACQGYLEDDLGRSKVEATADLCQQMNHQLDVEERRERFKRTKQVGKCLFCCVDSIETRRFIWNAVKDRVAFFADGRMSAEVVRVVTVADAQSREHYPTSLFSPSEAQTGACTAKSTIFTANIVAGLMLEQFSRWLRTLPVDHDIQLNLLASEMTVACA